MRRAFFIATIALLSSLMTAATAFAHAFPDHAEPAIGGTVHEAPMAVHIWFSEKIEPAFSRIEVVDAAGQRVDSGKAIVDMQDPRLLSVALKKLVPGIYKVTWHVVSADTHRTAGAFSFTVKP